MKKSINPNLLYSLLALTSLLIAMLGYAYTHKPFTAENLVGLFIAVWQVSIAFLIIALAGGIGAFILKLDRKNAPVRIALDLALGIPILSIATLILAHTIGVGLLPIFVFLSAIVIVFRKSIVVWLRLFSAAKPTCQGKYTTAVAWVAALIALMHFILAFTPTISFDSLVYHFSLPKAYLQLGHIQYLPDNMFWGMPQNIEMLYLLAMRLAGAESASLVSFLIGFISILGIAGFIQERFGQIAAWTATAALLAGETLTISLSSGYVEWAVILFGWAALATLDYWLETREPKLLFMCGVLCGAALGTKYTAGVILLGTLVALVFFPKEQKVKQRLTNLFVVGGLAVLLSLPWWIKNFISTGNPFYPFFFSSGAMNEFRLFHYHNVPNWEDWRSVMLLPWQATIWGVDSKEGFSASIGAIFVGLSPLVWVNWNFRTQQQKTSIHLAATLVLVGFLTWAVGSRYSGLLIQSRLFFGIFPAWALLTGAAMEAVWKLRALNIRFGRVAASLVLLMLGFNLFATWTQFVIRNPLAYLIRQEDQQRYLGRNIGEYAAVMKTLNEIPASSHVLMLWEARGFSCWPKCDADEVIDRWYTDINIYQTPEITLKSWIDQGYTHVLLFQAGADFVREHETRYSADQWQKLETLLSSLPPPVKIGNYALYSINSR